MLRPDVERPSGDVDYLLARCRVLTGQRDRARDIAVALEGQVAAVRALADECELLAAALAVAAREDEDEQAFVVAETVQAFEANLRAALDPDPADPGTGERP